MKSRYLYAAIAGGAVGVAIAGIFTYEALSERTVQSRSWSEIEQSDTLRVVTVPSSVSMFVYKGQWRGHEYETARQVAGALGLELRVELAPSERAMLDSLYTGQADLAAWPTYYSVAAAEGDLRPCGYRYEVGLVPVARRGEAPQLSDTAHYTLAVTEGSRPWLALQDSAVLSYFDLAPYRVEVVSADSANAEQLVAQVSEGRYDATLVATNMAQLLRTFHQNLEIGTPMIESEDSVGWVVTSLSDTLAAKIDSVCHYQVSAPRYPPIVKRYFEQSQGRQVKIQYILGGGRLSVYDQLFKNYSRHIGWDWRLLAAVAYTESRFDPLVVSHKGARGLMQLMPPTGERFGCPEAMLINPESNIQAGTRLIASLEASLRSRISQTLCPDISSYAEADSTTRAAVEADLIRFTLASYNAGLGHVFDAIALADTFHYNPARWEGNVGYALSLKVNPEYYDLPCVHSGKFNADVTLDYVENVLDTYELFCTLAKRE